jgi:N-acetylglucosamine-6-phosphate deacetylase
VTTRIITGARILTSGGWFDDHAVVVEHGKICAIVPIETLSDTGTITRLDGGFLIPGFIDTQVNGGGGVLFNDQPSVGGIATIAAAHRKFGTTALLPTLISDDLSVVAAAMRAVDAAMQDGVPGVIGIHVEGPFLNADKRGIHDATKFRALDADAIALLGSLKHGKTLVTLAPELAPKGAIRALVDRGVIVAAGHSLATYDEMARAIDEGLSGITHLFNAMTQMESRAPGVVGAALDSGLFCGLIVDGHHVHPATLRAAYRAKGPEELMLVTDAMPSVGADIVSFNIGATEIIAENGMLRSAHGTLAGSALDMMSAVRNSMEMMHIGLETASAMASRAPATFLGLALEQGQIALGCRADFIHVSAALYVERVWIGGEEA